MKPYRQNQKGQWIAAKGAKLYPAAQELATELGGKVIFTCPNYAVIAMSPTNEVTLWAK